MSYSLKSKGDPMAKKAQKKKANATKRRAPGKKLGRIDLNRILVPIDFSGFSRKALQSEIPFSRQFKASIDLIYVVEPTVYPADFSFGQVGFPAIEDELRKRAADELDELVRRPTITTVTPTGTNIALTSPKTVTFNAREEKMD